MSKNIDMYKYWIERLLPPVIYDFLFNLYQHMKFLIYQSQYSKVLSRNNEMSKLRRTDRAFVIATGPSLKEEDLARLAGEDCFTVSNAFLHQHIGQVNPLLHFIAPFHEPLVLENFCSWVDDADRRLPKSTGFVFGLSDFLKFSGSFKGRNKFFLYLGAWRGEIRQILLSGKILAPATVPLFVLPVLYGMGYREIFLLGCDHNTLKNYRGDAEHFFTGTAQDHRKNASDSGSWGGVIDEHKASLSVFLQYERYLRFFKKKGVRIVNLSKGSWLDFIERGCLSDLLP